jgi:hypothetical protein
VRDLLVVGAQAPDMELLRGRLARLGYRTVAVKTPDQALPLLRVSGGRIGAVAVPSDLPTTSLRGALEGLRRAAAGQELTFLGTGRDPGSACRRALREAGVELAAFDPIDPHTLRFQVNRALAGSQASARRRRGTVRAPADWPVTVRAGGRSKRGRVYSVSASGAFLTTEQPSVVRSRLALEISLAGERRIALEARVAMTNVPGNVMRRSLPFGMGVQFERISEAASVALLVYAEERLRALAV